MEEDVLTEEEMKRAVQQILKRSQTDPEFRKLCLDDPNEAIRRIAGKAVPLHLRIRFLESAPDKVGKSHDTTT